MKDPNPADSSTKDGTSTESEEGEFLRSPKVFNLLKVTGDLLMMPREMAMRREVCQIIAIKPKCPREKRIKAFTVWKFRSHPDKWFKYFCR